MKSIIRMKTIPAPDNLLFTVWQIPRFYSHLPTLLPEPVCFEEERLGFVVPATSLHKLAEVLRSQGMLDKAEIMLREALAIREKMLGQQNPMWPRRSATWRHS